MSVGGKGRPRLSQASEMAEKRTLALRLKVEGKTDAQIAEACGWETENTVWVNVKKQLSLTAAPEAAEYRQIHMQRLELLWRGLWPAARLGDPKSVEQAINVLKRESALLGLDAPVRVDIGRIADEYARTHNLDAEEREMLFRSIKEHMAATPVAIPERL
jgi:hypothetical protein